MKHTSAWLTLFFTATFVLSPLLTDPFSGFRADQLPIPQVDPPIQPAGTAFSIWGLIYIWLLISAGYGVWKRPNDKGWNRARFPLIISLAVGTPWLWVANQNAIAATIMIFIMAGGAIAALISGTERDEWALSNPIAIYAGWLTAAACVALGTTAAGHGIITDQDGWAIIGVSSALIAGCIVLWQRPMWAYTLTLIWALTWIIVANPLSPAGYLAMAGIIFLLIFTWFANGPQIAS